MDFETELKLATHWEQHFGVISGKLYMTTKIEGKTIEAFKPIINVERLDVNCQKGVCVN